MNICIVLYILQKMYYFISWYNRKKSDMNILIIFSEYYKLYTYVLLLFYIIHKLYEIGILEILPYEFFNVYIFL